MITLSDKTITRLIFCLAFSFLLLTARGQYYVVNDKEGYVHVRETPSVSGKIICYLENEMIVRETWNEDTSHKNWMFVEFYIPKKEAGTVKSKSEDWIPAVMNGYLLFKGWIYMDRLMNIEMQKKLKQKWVKEESILYNDTITIKFRDRKFDEKNHKIEMQKDELQRTVVKIDGHIGMPEGIPYFEIQTFSVEINHRKIEIPRSCFHDLYDPNLGKGTSGYIDDKGAIYIIMHNSDAGGSYEVIFIIKDNKYFGRYVFGGEC